jgi:transposase-like protein
MEQSSNSIVEQTGLDKKRALRAFLRIRMVLAQDVPVFGILCRNDQVWAEIVESIGEDTLLPLIAKKVVPGSTVCSDTWKAYTGVAARGYIHRLVNHGERQYTDGKANHTTDLKGFWGYLKRKLPRKVVSRVLAPPLSCGVCLEVQPPGISRKSYDTENQPVTGEMLGAGMGPYPRYSLI